MAKKHQDLRKLARDAEHFELPIFAEALNDAADRIETMTRDNQIFVEAWLKLFAFVIVAIGSVGGIIYLLHMNG